MSPPSPINSSPKPSSRSSTPLSRSSSPQLPPSSARPLAPGDATRRALLEAATEVFLLHGFRAARVQDIAAAARVRLSAISYHFGGKAGLYLAVLQHHAELALARSPWPSPEPDAPIERRFRGLVDALVRRMLDPASPSRIASLLVREAANPTDALEVMFERYTRPQAETLFELLRERLGPRASRDELAQVAISVVGQVMVYAALRPMVERFRPGFYSRGDGLDELVDHVARFSWAGIEALADDAASRQQAGPRRGQRPGSRPGARPGSVPGPGSDPDSGPGSGSRSGSRSGPGSGGEHAG